MSVQAGIFLKSTNALHNTLFAGTLIFIAEYNTDGAVGFVVNKLFDRSLADLEAFKHHTPFPLHYGGPVDNEHLFLLHKRPDLIDDCTLIADGIYLGGNFEQVVGAIDDGIITSKDIRIFVGYCGWDRGELEAELEEGSWIVAPGALDWK